MIRVTSRPTQICTDCKALRSDVYAGQCYDCYELDEIADIRTTPLKRLWQAMVRLWNGDQSGARNELKIGWERQTNTGDYLPGGYFDTRQPGWRKCDPDHRVTVVNLPTSGTGAVFIDLSGRVGPMNQGESEGASDAFPGGLCGRLPRNSAIEIRRELNG